MAPKIFVTGGTGYIGGSVLHTIVTNHPEYDVTALLRNVPNTFASTYPKVKIIKGDYDSFDILVETASQADVVVHNGDSDHEGSLKALITGQLKRPTPGFLIHLSGTGIVADHHDGKHLGKLNSKVWSDIKDVDAIASLPDYCYHRNTEKILFDTIAKHGDKLNIAIVCPPDIYGQGLGLGKTWSAFVPMLTKQSKKLGGVFIYEEGTNIRSWVHIKDLMQIYLKVVEAAANGGKGATWGREGYYFASTHEVSQIDTAKALAPILKKHGVIQTEELIQIPLDKLDSLIEFRGYQNIARYLFASNSRTRPERAEKLFGYAAKEKGLLDTLEDDVLAVIQK